MNDYIDVEAELENSTHETTQSSHHDKRSSFKKVESLEDLEHSLSTLIENYIDLKQEKEMLENKYFSLQQHNDELIVKQNKTEHRIRNLLDKLSKLAI